VTDIDSAVIRTLQQYSTYYRLYSITRIISTVTPTRGIGSEDIEDILRLHLLFFLENLVSCSLLSFFVISIIMCMCYVTRSAICDTAIPREARVHYKFPPKNAVYCIIVQYHIVSSKNHHSQFQNVNQSINR
jgi:hypothetical protein